MKKRILMSVVFSAVLAGLVVAAQDKYSVKVLGGLAFSEFRGYEAWQTISVSRNEKVATTILGNPVMIKASSRVFPATGNLFRTVRRWPKFIGRRSRTSSFRVRQCRTSLRTSTLWSRIARDSPTAADTACLITTQPLIPSNREPRQACPRRETTPGADSRATPKPRVETTFSQTTGKGEAVAQEDLLRGS
jgi:hypothetical protein